MVQKQVTMIPRNHEKVAQEVTMMKLIFLRMVLSQLTVVRRKNERSLKICKLGRERKVKYELINSLQIDVSSLKVEINNLEKKADDQEQYSRRNCLLIHGLTETKTEDTDEMVLDVINNKLNIEMCQTNIDRSHRLGKRKGPGQKPRAVVVKFTRYNDRHHVFRNKKLLKGTSISVTESLTLKRMAHLKKAREHGFAYAWTIDGKITFKENDGNPKVYYF